MSASIGNAGILAKALHDLLENWDQTTPHWRDEARDRFAKDFVDELAAAVRAALGAIQEIENEVRRVRRECT